MQWTLDICGVPLSDIFLGVPRRYWHFSWSERLRKNFDVQGTQFRFTAPRECPSLKEMRQQTFIQKVRDERNTGIIKFWLISKLQPLCLSSRQTRPKLKPDDYVMVNPANSQSRSTWRHNSIDFEGTLYNLHVTRNAKEAAKMLKDFIWKSCVAVSYSSPSYQSLHWHVPGDLEAAVALRISWGAISARVAMWRPSIGSLHWTLKLRDRIYSIHKYF